MIDDLLKILKAVKEDFRELLVDERIPLEKRMEWFANYADDFLPVEFNDGADHLSVEMSGYLEDGYNEQDLERINKILHDGISVVVS